ncbi:hypothetical protein ET471_05265 [Xylanimonas protaetiae]|uniref:Uncharacterized protein n=1 Tax=Xylanimonas protaetiae TaxID=2509457 RepID=A0A4P6F2Q5_9MICO|nr:hypothetical protein ET471_05265 [Xylanimonas protaetiae]
MSAQKKRGLGRGLGALIPSGPEGDRPVDVFFPAGARVESEEGQQTASVLPPLAAPAEGRAAASTGRSGSWDAAMSSGRLAIRTSGVARPATASDGSGDPVPDQELDEAVAGSVLVLEETGAATLPI